MTTDETPTRPRSIDELSKLGTYQGMTDTEVQLLMDYNVKIAAERADGEARQREAAEQLHVMQAESAKLHDAAMASFKRACAASPAFESVVNDG